MSRQKLTGNLPTGKALNDLKRPVGRPFEKGRKKTGGRQKGTPNKCDVNIRDAVIEACAQVGANGKGRDGFIGYIRTTARKHRVEMLAAIVKLWPQTLLAQLDHTVNLDVKYETLEEAREALRREGIVVDHLLLPHQPPVTIEDEQAS